MLTLYIVCAIVGGGLMLLSAFGGLVHADVGGGHDVSIDADHSIDIEHDLSVADVEQNVELSHDFDAGFSAGDFWLALVSMRFLTYFVGTLGIFGLALTWFSGLSSIAVGWWSVGSALLIGYGGSLLFRYLRAEGETSGVTTHDYIGALGHAVVTVRGSQPGKVRVCIKGDTLDLIALSEGEKQIEKGEEIVIVGLEGDRVRVAPKGDYLD